MNYFDAPIRDKPRITIPSTVKGRYKIEAVKADGSRRLLADWFDNLITDLGLNLLGTNPAWFQWCLVGSGTTAPANSDTALVSFVASTQTVTVSSTTAQGSSPYFGTSTKTYRFPIGTATGNLSEVGIGATTTNGNLFSRALILDGGGSPTTITVLSTEALDVTYQLQQFVPLVDVTGTVVINSISYAYTVRAATATSVSQWALTSAESAGLFGNVSVYNGTIGAITATPSGSTAASGSIAIQAYSSNSHRIDTIISFGLTDGNLAGGISAMLMIFGVRGSMGAFQVGFSPALPKDGSHTMTLTVRQSWDRH